LRERPPRTTAESRRVRVCVLSACALASAAVVTAAFVPIGAAATPQQEPPPTITTVPTPAPDPPPVPKPKPKPVPRPTTTPAPPPQQSQPAPTPVTPSVQHNPVVRQSPAVKKPAVKKTVKHKVRHTKPKPHVKPQPVVPKLNVPDTAGAPAVLPNPIRSASGGSAGIASLLIVMGLALAITCFAVAVIPATAVPWRPAAIFVSERQVDLTVVGLALLMGAAFTLLWTGA
jgi:hypothetical protein